jgi:RHS repeat-associated protein
MRGARKTRCRLSWRGAILRLAVACVAGGATAAKAEPDYPEVVSPLRVATDDHGVNVVSGKMQLPTPSLSVPAAPNLKFDYVQNAAPYVRGTITSSSLVLDPDLFLDPYGPGRTDPKASYSVHAGTGAADSFKCVDGDCSDNVVTQASATGTGSQFIAFNTRLYTQGGTGAQWTFDLKYSQMTVPGTTLSPGHTDLLYYASHANFPNGETITYTYDSYAPPGDYASRTFYRPIRLTSSTGYYITIAYQSDTWGTNDWQTVREAALYSSADPSTPLGKLTYSGNTITDLLGRTFTCTGCSNMLGVSLETTIGSLQLPGESGSAQAVSPNAAANNQVISSIVKDGVTWNYAYTNLRYNAASLTWLYDAVTVTGPNGYSMTYAMRVGGTSQYDYHNEITSITDGLGRANQISTDPRSRPIRQVLPEGNESDIAYDDWGNVVSKTVKAKPGSGLADLSETASIDATNCSANQILCWRPAWSRDAMGRQTDYAYNGAGQLIEQTDPADQNGVRRKTYVTYDASSGISRRTVVRLCGDTTTCGTAQEIRTEYTYWGSTLLPATETKVDGATGVRLTTTYSYDNAGRPLVVDGPLPGTDDASYFSYDVVGRKIWEIGPKKANGYRAAKRFTYRPADDKPTAVEAGTVTDPNNPAGTFILVGRTDTAYDSRRNPVRETASGSDGLPYGLTERSFDDRGQLVCQAQRMNATNFGAATDGCTLATPGSYGPDRITRNVYDAAGQLLQVQRAYGTPLQQNYATYEYTPNGKQKAVIDANNNRAELTWDGFDRQRRWIFPSSTSAGVANQADYEEYSYDAAGNRTSLRKRDNTILTYAYDGTNRLTLKTVPASATGAAGYSVFYNYDANGLQTWARFGSASGPGISTTYDGFGRIASTTTTMDGTARTISSFYDGASNRNRVTATTGYVMNFTYDAAGDMTALVDGNNQMLVQFAYDPAGRRQTLALGPGGNNPVSYGYDAVSRLASLGHTLAGTANYQLATFAYNPASQIVTRTQSNDAFASTSAYNVSRAYGVNGLNQYTAAGSATFTYDANGNLTSDGTNTFVYDAENRLVSRSGGVTLSYDPNGRLWQVSAPSGTTRFEYDGDKLLEEFNTSGSWLRLYAWGPSADEPLIWYETTGGPVRRYLHADHQGSVIAVADDSGSPIVINAYDPWGIPNAGNVGRFQYTGQAWLAELGMYYYKARIYSPTLGRFLQTDPVGYSGGMGLYAYVGNDPLNQNDSSGLASAEEIRRARQTLKRLEGAIRREIRDADVARPGSRLHETSDDSRITALKSELKALASLDPAALADMRVDPPSASVAQGLLTAMDGARAEQVFVARDTSAGVSYAPAPMEDQTRDSGQTGAVGRLRAMAHPHGPGAGREYPGVGDPLNVLTQRAPNMYQGNGTANAIGWNGTRFTLTNFRGGLPSYSSAPGWMRDTFQPW